MTAALEITYSVRKYAKNKNKTTRGDERVASTQNLKQKHTGDGRQWALKIVTPQVFRRLALSQSAASWHPWRVAKARPGASLSKMRLGRPVPAVIAPAIARDTADSTASAQIASSRVAAQLCGARAGATDPTDCRAPAAAVTGAAATAFLDTSPSRPAAVAISKASAATESARARLISSATNSTVVALQT